MHLTNRLFWEYCQNKYKRYFLWKGNDILEVGSYDVNGSVRDYFTNYEKYIGIDWRPGPGVDLVCFAHEMKFSNQFDTIISASMLEHDQYWKRSISTMVKNLKEDGILLLSWGAALNHEHDLEQADDGGFHPLPAGYVINLLQRLKIYVHEFRYEGNQFRKYVRKKYKSINHGHEGMGEVCLVAFKDKRFAIGKRCIDRLLPEDNVFGIKTF